MLVLFALAIVTLLGATLMQTVQSDATDGEPCRLEGRGLSGRRGRHRRLHLEARRGRLYYSHHVARRRVDPPDDAAAHSWPPTRRGPSGLTLDVPDRQDKWRQLSNGYEYNLEITTPTTARGRTHVAIVATGRKTGSTTD